VVNSSERKRERERERERDCDPGCMIGDDCGMAAKGPIMISSGLSKEGPHKYNRSQCGRTRL
jgi:hypothetical protein